MSGRVDTVTAVQNETVSHLAYRVYGTAQGKVEAILELNPNLCKLPPLLPAGTVVRLPAETGDTTPVIPSVNLWD